MTFTPYPLGPHTDTAAPRATPAKQAWTLTIVLGALLLLWVLVEVGTPLWIWTFGRHWLWLGPATWVLAGVWSGAVVRRQCRNWLLAALPLVLASLLAFTTINPDDPAYIRHGVRDDPRGWFEEHRGEFNQAVDWAEEANCCSSAYYGDPLPASLAHLTARGLVSGDLQDLYFVQWHGIPDDSGGFFYSPDGTPQGDMFGTACFKPVDLDDGWWMCGMGE